MVKMSNNVVFFFSSRRRHTRLTCDWSSDVCSSDLATLRLEIVTTERIAYAEDVEMVTLPGSEGELGVYPKHVPVLTILKPGEVRVVKDKRATSLAVGEGFIEITPERVSILTDMALEAQVIDEAAAEKAVARAQAA